MNILSNKKFEIEHKLIIAISTISCLLFLIKVVNPTFYIDLLSQLAIYSHLKVFNFRFWQFFSYLFIHANFLHLLLNMVMLYFFSMLFFTYFNPKQFLKTFFFGGFFAAIFYIIVGTVIGKDMYAVGASGAIMAVFFAVVGYNPLMRVQLIIFGNIPIYYIALAFLGFDILQLFFDNAGGHLIHIGGSLFGFIYGKYFVGFNIKKSLKKQKKPSHLKTIRNRNTSTKKIGTDVTIQQKIDVILDKISKSGASQ